VQELLDVMIEVFLEPLASVLNAGIEVDWSLAEKLEAFLKGDDLLLGDRVDLFPFF